MYCAISNALEQCKAEGVVDVFQTVKGVRMQKPGAVTTQVNEGGTHKLFHVFMIMHVLYTFPGTIQLHI